MVELQGIQRSPGEKRAHGARRSYIGAIGKSASHCPWRRAELIALDGSIQDSSGESDQRDQNYADGAEHWLWTFWRERAVTGKLDIA
jgi:hypothetical protein